MNMLKTAQKLNHLLLQSNNNGRITIQSASSSLPLRHLHHRQFSTDNQPQPQSQSQSSTPIDSFLHPPPPKGAVYGRLAGVSPNTLKTDIINLFEGCNLTLDDIKVDYDRMFHPKAMLVQFRSASGFSTGVRELARKSRSFRLEKVQMDQQNWNLITPYNGRYAIIRGIPRNALIDDVERLLAGCNYEASSLEIFTSRGIRTEIIRMAKVRFPSQIEAMNAVIRKNGSFCLNNRIAAQLIQ